MGLSPEQVDVDVIREGRRGLLGIGSEDAIVRVTAKASVTVVPTQRGRGGRADRPSGGSGGDARGDNRGEGRGGAPSGASGSAPGGTGEGGGSRRGRRGGRGRGGAGGASVSEDGPSRPGTPTAAAANTDSALDDDQPPSRVGVETAASGPSRFAQVAPARTGGRRDGGRDGGRGAAGGGRRDGGRGGFRDGGRDGSRDAQGEGQRGGRGGYRAGAISSGVITGPTDEPPIPVPGVPDDYPTSPPEGVADEVEFAGRSLRDILTLLGLTHTEITARDPESPSDGGTMMGQVFDIYGENEDETEELGALIGRRGETLQALQYLVNVITSGKYNSEHMFGIDIDGYRRRREEALVAMAQRIAAEVRETGDVITLEPMPAAERRIIHLALRDEPGVRTESVGSGDRRQVEVLPSAADDDDSDAPHASGDTADGDDD